MGFAMMAVNRIKSAVTKLVFMDPAVSGCSVVTISIVQAVKAAVRICA